MNNDLKSPLNYTGGKFKLLNQIIPLFPQKTVNFVDLFAGGCNVSLNIKAEKIICNDNLKFLIDLYKKFQTLSYCDILNYIEKQVIQFELSLTNEEGYKKIRAFYNKEKNPLDLFILTAFSFNHQIRFNNQHQFNTPFGRERSCFNETMRLKLFQFVDKIQNTNIEFTCFDFDKFDLSFLTENDFVYCDPPYLISLATYNDGKRGFTGWGEYEEIKLLKLLDNLHQKNIKFALSNILEHKAKTNSILKKWLEKNSFLNINYINAHYNNANYQSLIKEDNKTIELLVTNYKPALKTLFD